MSYTVIACCISLGLSVELFIGYLRYAVMSNMLTLNLDVIDISIVS